MYLLSALVACVVAAGTAFVTTRLLAPAPRTSSPNTIIEPSANTMILEGVAEAPYGKETLVFYKTPFAAPPNLTFPEGLDFSLEVADQQAQSFKLKRAPQGFGPAKVKWKAEGQPAK